MKTRPWPVLLLAALHVLSPFGNILLGATVQRMSVAQYWTTLIHTSDPTTTIAFFFVFPLAGLALYLYRQWSYAVFSAAISFGIFINIQSLSKHPRVFPLWLFSLLIAIDLAVVAYFLLPSVWAPYLDPKMRWWETKPRYRLKQRAHFSFKGGIEDCLIVDFAEGGTFLRSRRPLDLGDEIQLQLAVAGQHFHFQGKVVYHRARVHSGYGIQFIHTKKSKQQSQRLTAGFRAMGIPCGKAPFFTHITM